MTDKYNAKGDVTDEYVEMLERKIEIIKNAVLSFELDDEPDYRDYCTLLDYIKVVVG